ncbi:unnamed protein product [Microthlaspi erraticum]|uniref:Uncharacterized protein n=1 Tax=Microthlaspi erraticum TaxID=1685480 RepID=A0A6D2JEQ8_9BRAS|nr:unnamed protein product [Microthlaspi erraticum]
MHRSGEIPLISSRVNAYLRPFRQRFEVDFRRLELRPISLSLFLASAARSSRFVLTRSSSRSSSLPELHRVARLTLNAEIWNWSEGVKKP